ncbi:kelch motif domain-containing protein, putative, partial [Eimeria necatrix]
VRSAGCAVSSANHLYALGGINADHQIHNSLEVLNPEGGQWVFLAPMPGPRMDCAAVFLKDSILALRGGGGPRVDCAVVLGKDFILVTGGQDGEVLSSTCFYNPETNEWRQGPSMGTPRYGHNLVVTAL